MTNKLNAAQQLVLDYLRQCIQNGVPPSVREICSATGIKSTSSVHNHLRVLEEGGYITRTSGLNRAIRLTEESPIMQVPLLGQVKAGLPTLAIQEALGYVPFPADRYSGSELFALRVSGESMKNAGILDGDIIIAEKCSTAFNGEIVVALLEDDTTVKRIYCEQDGRIRLQPENDDFQPIFATDVTILGRIVSCIRYYG